MRDLAYANPGIFTFGIDAGPVEVYSEMSDIGNFFTFPDIQGEQARKEKENRKIARALKEKADEIEFAKNLLRDFFISQQGELVEEAKVSRNDQMALLNFDGDFQGAKDVLKRIVERQIELVESFIQDSKDFTQPEKGNLKCLVNNVKLDLTRSIDALEPKGNPVVFAKTLMASISSLDVSLKAAKGIKGDALSREDQLKIACGLLGGFLGLIGIVGGPFGLAAGLVVGVCLGVYLGKAIARLSASPDEKLKNKCDEYRDPSIFSIMEDRSLHFGQGRGCSLWGRPQSQARNEEFFVTSQAPGVPGC